MRFFSEARQQAIVAIKAGDANVSSMKRGAHGYAEYAGYAVAGRSRREFAGFRGLRRRRSGGERGSRATLAPLNASITAVSEFVNIYLQFFMFFFFISHRPAHGWRSGEGAAAERGRNGRQGNTPEDRSVVGRGAVVGGERRTVY
jgi:hypothetical protein